MRDEPYRPRCLSLDLEVGKEDGRIHAFGAVRGDTGHGYNGGGSASELTRLDALAEGVSFLLGHNLIAFDLPYLKAAKPDLRLLALPAVDTLRLSPLAFPRNSYHALVKHYQDGGLVRGRINDPELDARLALAVFGEQREALRKAEPALLAAWHWLTTPEPDGADRAHDDFFSALRGAPRPVETEARAAIGRRLEGAACATHAREAVAEAATAGWALAYALAWLSVAGGDSVMPPWVRHQFPEAGHVVRRLRDTACTDPACGWCRERHDARREMKHWFGFDNFRPEPADADGRPLQQAIVEAAMAGKQVLGILPTGHGQVALLPDPRDLPLRQDRRADGGDLAPGRADGGPDGGAGGAGDRVLRHGQRDAVHAERAQALDRVRLGGAGILLIAPEQLRSRSLRRALDQREIGGWVLDEAHCLSRWGHDFRPDYRYVSRFICEKAGAESVPPLLCLTATAKPDVRDDILRHFRQKLGIELAVFDGGAERTNLSYEVIPTTGGEKFAHIHQVLES